MTIFQTEFGEYKGNKTISIKKGDNRVMSFGLTKAKAILSSMEDIKRFVEENSKDEVQDTSEV
jgi:tRNA threonylcarbamoyladenosine modification (KEOPS) complex Cgi121 subunit